MASREEGNWECSRLAAPVGERKCFSLQNLKIKVSGHSPQQSSFFWLMCVSTELIVGVGKRWFSPASLDLLLPSPTVTFVSD